MVRVELGQLPVGSERAQPPVPVIYHRRFGLARLPAAGRALAGVVALACLSVLMVALWFDPDASGVGSHQKLGLRPCSFVDRTGLPCPSCGMTTAFAHFVRGNLPASLYVQPLGAVLALLVSMTFWTAAYIAITGRPVYRLLRFIDARYYVGPLIALAVLAWAWKILIRLRGVDGW